MATLTIDFIAPTPVPVNGFIVKYKVVGTSTYTTVFPNPTSSPVILNPILLGKAYEGTIQSDCGNSTSSSTTPFLVYGSQATSIQYGISSTAMCGSPANVVYISNQYSDIGPGVTVYTDPLMTQLLTGYNYINNTSGIIFPIGNTTAVVSASTGVVCGQQEA